MCTRLCYMWTAAQAQEAQAQEGDKALESHHVLHYCFIRCCILCIQTTGSYLLPTDQLRDHTGKKGLVLKDARRNARSAQRPVFYGVRWHSTCKQHLRSKKNRAAELWLVDRGPAQHLRARFRERKWVSGEG
jgi:hypothetical protein